jgi:imidazolonepropionase-like amidohydrolase
MKIVLALAIAVTLSTGARLAAQPAPAKLALVGGMLLDGYEVPPIHHGVVLIEGNRIVAKGHVGDVTVPEDARVIDTAVRCCRG